MTKDKAYKIFKLLKEHYPNAKMILKWGNNFELLVAIILSAQCTDKKVNEVTSTLFPKHRIRNQELRSKYDKYISEAGVTVVEGEKSDRQGPEEIIEIVNFAEIPLLELEQDIRSTGFYHNKAKSVKNAAIVVLDKFKGILPKTIKELTLIPGVGRKTANVFLGNAYKITEGVAVDTHVKKQSQDLGLSKNTDPDKIEQDLMKLFDKKDWFKLTYLLIEHGRNLRKNKKERLVCDNKDCILCKST